jgi:two-component system sensor kinase FixL
MTVAPGSRSLPDLLSVAEILRKMNAIGIWAYDVHSGQGVWSDEMFDLLELPWNDAPPQLSTLHAMVGSEDWQAIKDEIRAAIAEGGIFQMEHRMVGSSGEHKFLKACGTLKDVGGMKQLIGSLQDVTEERIAYHAMIAQAADLQKLKDGADEENKRFREFFDQAPVFVAIGSVPDLRFEYANRAYSELVGNRQLVGKTVAEALPEVVAQGLIAVLRSAAETGEPYIAIEEPMYLQDGSGDTTPIKYLTYIYQPVRGLDDRITDILCIGYDVTAQRLAKDEAEVLRDELLRSSQLAAMGTMAATLAHELNQPLTSLVMFSAGLNRRLGATSDPKVTSALQAIQDESLRASEIMRRMRAVATGLPVRHRPVEIRSVLEHVLRQPMRARADVQLELSLEHGGFVRGDDIQLQQVITNLLRNACEAMAGFDNKTVHIATSDQAGETLVTISDTGPGIPDKLLPRIFEGTVSAKEGGMGIGLAICRTIVEAHGGRIGAHNNEHGGATFWFTLHRIEESPVIPPA